MSIKLADLDGDTDLDLVTSTLTFLHNSIIWYANEGDEGFTEQQQLIDSHRVQSLNVMDLDNDNDLDVVAVLDNYLVAWFANDGEGGFGQGETISDEAGWCELMVADDLDADADLDIIIASSLHDYVAWFRNDLISAGTTPTEYQLLSNFPNPFNSSTTITFELPTTTVVDLRVYNLLGGQIVTLAKGNFCSGVHQVLFDGSGLAAGTYICTIVAGNRYDGHRITVLK